MNAEQKTWSLVTLILCATVIATIFIMAQCSIAVEVTDASIGDCAKAGGHWNYNGGNSFCEPRAH